MDIFENKQFEKRTKHVRGPYNSKKYEGRKRVINNIVLKTNFRYLKNKDKLKYKDCTFPLGLKESIRTKIKARVISGINSKRIPFIIYV